MPTTHQRWDIHLGAGREVVESDAEHRVVREKRLGCLDKLLLSVGIIKLREIN